MYVILYKVSRYRYGRGGQGRREGGDRGIIKGTGVYVTLHHKTNKKSHGPVLCYG